VRWARAGARGCGPGGSRRVCATGRAPGALFARGRLWRRAGGARRGTGGGAGIARGAARLAGGGGRGGRGRGRGRGCGDRSAGCLLVVRAGAGDGRDGFAGLAGQAVSSVAVIGEEAMLTMVTHPGDGEEIAYVKESKDDQQKLIWQVHESQTGHVHDDITCSLFPRRRTRRIRRRSQSTRCEE